MATGLKIVCFQSVLFARSTLVYITHTLDDIESHSESRGLRVMFATMKSWKLHWQDFEDIFEVHPPSLTSLLHYLKVRWHLVIPLPLLLLKCSKAYDNLESHLTNSCMYRKSNIKSFNYRVVANNFLKKKWLCLSFALTMFYDVSSQQSTLECTCI